MEGFAADPFGDGHGDVAAVENGEGQHVHNGEVDVQDDGEPEDHEEGVGVLEEVVIDAADADGAAHVGGADVGLGREEFLDHVDHAAGGGGELLADAGVVDLAFAGGMPDDAEHGFGDFLGAFVGEAGGDGDGLLGFGAADGEGDGFAVGGLDGFADLEAIVDGLAVEGEELVTGLEVGFGGGAVFLDLADHGGFFAGDADIFERGAFEDAAEEGRFFRSDAGGFGGHGALDEALAGAVDFEDDVGAFAGDDGPADGVDEAFEAFDGLVVDFDDFIADFEAAFGGGAVFGNVANGGGDERFGFGFAEPGDEEGEEGGEAEAEEGTGEGDDDFVEGGDGWQGFFGVDIAFDGLHGGHLGEGDEAAGGDAAEAVLDAVDGFFPEGFAEPDLEAVDVEAAPAGGEEVAPFVDEDHQIEHQKDLDDEDDGVEDFAEGAEREKPVHEGYVTEITPLNGITRGRRL